MFDVTISSRNSYKLLPRCGLVYLLPPGYGSGTKKRINEEMESSMKRDLFLIVEQRQWPHRCAPQKNYLTMLRNVQGSSWLGWRVYMTFRINFLFFLYVLWIMKSSFLDCYWIYKICDARSFSKIFKGINFLIYDKRLNLSYQKIRNSIN